jgi:hypothetical protein
MGGQAVAQHARVFHPLEAPLLTAEEEDRDDIGCAGSRCFSVAQEQQTASGQRRKTQRQASASGASRT